MLRIKSLGLSFEEICCLTLNSANFELPITCVDIIACTTQLENSANWMGDPNKEIILN